MASTLHTKTLTHDFGVAAASANGLTMSVKFIETKVDAAHNRSWVEAQVSITNNSTNIERKYRFTDGKIHVRVGNSTKQLKGKNVIFDIKGGKTVLIARLTWKGIDHTKGSVAVAFNGNYPSAPSGVGSIPSTTGVLTLNNAPARPTAPVGLTAAYANVGTSTQLTWTNKDNKSPTGAVINAPYSTLSLLVSQANYPDHFTPVTRVSDISNVAGGTLTSLSNYMVQTFWYVHPNDTKTLPSPPVLYANVAAKHLIKVKPPANPPASATGWGLAVVRKVGSAPDINNARIQSYAGSPKIPLSVTWTSPKAGPSTTGAKPPSSALANNFVWSQNSVIPLTNHANTATVATVGGFWYQFSLLVTNRGAPRGVQGRPVIYYAPGTAPSWGTSTTGDAGDGTPGLLTAPAANVPAFGQAVTQVNASASVTPTVAQLVDLSPPPASLAQAADPATLINYCSDPRAYWLTASTSGNNTGAPYTAEVNTSAYATHNAQTLPNQMTYALRALGLDGVDRSIQQTFIGANNNTGNTVSPYVYVSNNPDLANIPAALPVPAGSTTFQVSAFAWVNSSNNAPGRTVQPFSTLRFAATYANGVTIGSANVAQPSIPVNTLVRLVGSYTLPANTANVAAAFVTSTASGANWSGGLQAGDNVHVTGFLATFNEPTSLPYFDGGWPSLNPTVHQLSFGANVGLTGLTQVTQVSQSNVQLTATSQGDITTWPPQVSAPLATFLAPEPYEGWTAEWQGDPSMVGGYGGSSALTAPQLVHYALPSGSTALTWSDPAGSDGNLWVMPFDAGNATVSIAGDAALANMGTGADQIRLVAGQTYSVITNAYCPGTSTTLAEFVLVTNATTVTSPVLATSGQMSWSFTVPAGTTAAYLAIKVLTNDPEQPVRFTAPVLRLGGTSSATSALGYLGTANAVPLRVAQIKVPAYYRIEGWPTPATYLFQDASQLNFTPTTLPGTVGAAVQVDPTSIKPASDLRFLAGYNFNQSTGQWDPYASTGVHSFSLLGGDSGNAVPTQILATANDAFTYPLASGSAVNTEIQLDSLVFNDIGSYLYSDALNSAGLTHYTVIMALSLDNTYDLTGGLWSSCPTAGTGGPDTDADLTTFNYRALGVGGTSLTLSSPGATDQTFQVGQMVSLHKPCYVAVTFANDSNTVLWATDPSQVAANRVALAGVSGALNGSVVLGADATNGLDGATFSLFEVNVYYGALTSAQVRKEIQLLGACYG